MEFTKSSGEFTGFGDLNMPVHFLGTPVWLGGQTCDNEKGSPERLPFDLLLGCSYCSSAALLASLRAGYHGDGVQCILGAKSALCHIQAAGNRTSENWAASVEVECKSNCLEI